MNQEAPAAVVAPAAPPPPPPAPPAGNRWLFPLLRVVFVLAAGVLVWIIASNWDRWTGARRYQ
jgi:hypothetical protein